jgi:imidazole glycerol-phosphate synthase subunit HisF
VLTKRLIACLDVVGGMVTKATKFQDNIPVGPADEVLHEQYLEGIDEIIFYDIKASPERRQVDLGLLERIATKVYVPFTVGGGIKSVENMHAILDAGAEKISIDSMAVRDPEIITRGADAFGSQCIVVSMQAQRVPVSDAIPSGFEIFIDGARVATGMDAVQWAARASDLGAGELVVNSIDQDGTHSGYDIELLQAVCAAVRVPVVASGGAGEHHHISDMFHATDATAAVVSSLLYSPRLPKNSTVQEMKQHLEAEGVDVRPHQRGLAAAA